MADRPLRVAVVGSGPAGLYTTEAVLAGHRSLLVDVFERLATPHGLVRYGVAPDHWTVKSKQRAFDRILDHPRVRLVANVEIGTRIPVSDLLARYDAVVLAVGASTDRRLDIPGEDLPGVHSARDFVGWYSGHPDAVGLHPDLSGRTAVIIGMGNVALDVARMLLSDPEHLAKTDMTAAAVQSLRQAMIETVRIVGRRGPSQAGFTPKELVELSEVPGVGMVVEPEAIAGDVSLPTDDPLETARRTRNLDLFSRYAEVGGDQPRTVTFDFLTSPIEVVGRGRVEGVRLARNRLVERDDRLSAEPTGDVRTVEADIVFRSVGFRPLPMAGVPFDHTRNVIPTSAGRVLDGGDPVPGLYATGWVRRGPSGVIGTNKVDAGQVAASVLADLTPGHRPPADVEDWLETLPSTVIDGPKWDRLRREERRRGAAAGKTAEKFLSADEALDFLRAGEVRSAG